MPIPALRNSLVAPVRYKFLRCNSVKVAFDFRMYVYTYVRKEQLMCMITYHCILHLALKKFYLKLAVWGLSPYSLLIEPG